MEKRLHVYYSGAVQGVGFRFTAERIALSLGLKGWVKNLEDGRVEAVCEGGESAIRSFTRKIDELFKDYITDTEVSWPKPTSEFADFEIRF
jgi:acylphosphatase